MSERFEGRTLKNAGIGVVVTTAAYFVPVLNAIAPIFGGFVSGYLQKEGVGGGMKVGALKGILMVLPAVPIAIIGGALLSTVPMLGEYLAGSTVVLTLIIVTYSTFVGVLGGFCGGLTASMTSAESA